MRKSLSVSVQRRLLPSFRSIRFTTLLFLTYVLIGCNSSENSERISQDTLKTGTKSNEPADTVAVRKLDTHLDVLYLTETEFRTIRRGEGRKIVFEFFLYDPANGSLTLTAYPSRNHDMDRSDTVSLHFARKSDLDIAGRPVVFAVQKLPRQSVTAIFQALGPNADDNQVVAFFPDRDESNYHIYYEVYVFPSLNVLKTQANTFTKIADTNPSPPASSSPERLD